MKLTILRLLGLGFGGLLLSLIFTPIVRGVNRRLGMVDQPDARRINKIPIPRGGGVAIYLSVVIAYSLFLRLYGDSLMTPDRVSGFLPLVVLGSAIVALGYADDKWSLSPKLKLLGQAAVAFGAWAWAGVGFTHVFPSVPPWLDCVMTMFWFLGAINAFNLIDGLDGLATGLAMIATIGMAGVLVFTGSTGMTYFHAVFFGALLGFLRYNYNPASVFLGDSGSMFIGFVLAILPLHFNTPGSFFVSLGVPLLAMGVPIFDTALAILRRSIRHLLVRRGSASVGNDKVMTADTDHLHHRILRAVGLNQRKAAWVLYGIAFFMVLISLGNIVFTAQRAGLWLFGLTIAVVIVSRNFARVELYDAAFLLGDIAHDRDIRQRRKYLRLAVPIFIVSDLLVMVISYFVIAWIVKKPIAVVDFMLAIPIMVFSTFVSLVFFRAYVTIWSRAVISNYCRLFIAAAFGAIIGTLGVYFAPGLSIYKLRVSFPLFVLIPFCGFAAIRFLRPLIRDVLYALDSNRLMQRKDVSRILVYGAGLRYSAFRRELVRHTTSGNRRIIVGILDDDPLLHGQYIGGIQVKGTINDASKVIRDLNVDTVVIACDFDQRWMKIVMELLRPTGVKVTVFGFSEEEIKWLK